MTFDRHVFPLSGQVLEQQSDGRWRMISAAQAADEVSGAFRPGPDDWEDPDEPESVRGKAQRSPHPSNPPETWWMVMGRGPAGAVSVTTADGVHRGVAAAGDLWVCEWLGPTQAAKVTVDGRSTTMFRRPVHYRD